MNQVELVRLLVVVVDQLHGWVLDSKVASVTVSVFDSNSCLEGLVLAEQVDGVVAEVVDEGGSLHYVASI